MRKNKRKKNQMTSCQLYKKFRTIHENQMKIVLIDYCKYFILKEKHDSNKEYKVILPLKEILQIQNS